MTRCGRHAGTALAGPIRCPSMVAQPFPRSGGGIPKAPPKQGFLWRIHDHMRKVHLAQALGTTLPVVLDYLLVGVTGGFQTDKVARAFEGDDDGMYARFCFAWPEEPAHMPLSNEVSEIEPEIQNALVRIINLPADEDGVFAPRTIDLSADAVAAFEGFRAFLSQAKKELDGREREWVAKGGTHVLRLTGTLAYLDWAMLGGDEPHVIGEEYVEAAVRLWRDYFWPHSRAALRQIGLTEKHTNPRRALFWIRNNQKSEVSLQ